MAHVRNENDESKDEQAQEGMGEDFFEYVFCEDAHDLFTIADWRLTI